MSILRNKAKARGGSRAAETSKPETVISDSRPAESGVGAINTDRWITGERVRAHAFYQLSIEEIAAVLGCDPALISPFADACREGREAGKDAILNALTDNAVVHHNVRAQLFLHNAQMRSAALDAASAKEAELARFYAMTSEEREQQVVHTCERVSLDKMYPEEMAQIRAERAHAQRAEAPKAD